MSNFVTIVCPYCGFKCRADAIDGAVVVYCCADDGGCDRRFVADVKYRVEVKTFKIEEDKKL